MIHLYIWAQSTLSCKCTHFYCIDCCRLIALKGLQQFNRSSSVITDQLISSVMKHDKFQVLYKAAVQKTVGLLFISVQFSVGQLWNNCSCCSSCPPVDTCSNLGIQQASHFTSPPPTSYFDFWWSLWYGLLEFLVRNHTGPSEWRIGPMCPCHIANVSSSWYTHP